MSEEAKTVPPPPNRSSPWAVAIVVGALLVAGFATVRQARQGRAPAPLEPALKFDDASYRATDAGQIAWQETHSFETGFQNPRGIALSGVGKRLFVAGDRHVRAFRFDGCRENAFEVGNEAYCIAVASDGRLAVGLKDRVELWTGAGQRLAQWETLGATAHLTGLCASGDSFYAGDAGNRVVLQFDAQGRIVGRFGERNLARNQPGLVMPSPHLDVAVDAHGTLWLNNPGRHRLEAYAENGDRLRTWGSSGFDVTGFCGCCNPTDFAILPDGRFVTAEKGIPRVKVSTADGVLENVVAGAESFEGDNIGLDLAAAPDGRIFVLDSVRKTVRVFAPKTAETLQRTGRATGDTRAGQ